MVLIASNRMDVGFSTLRGFVTQRPTLRTEALNILLELTTHPGTPLIYHPITKWLTIYPEKVTRGAAIITVKRWVGDSQPMDGMVRDFALQLLRRLQHHPPQEKKASDGDDENMEDGQLPPEDLLQTPYLNEQLELPARKGEVLQHVELLFALSAKAPEFLDEYVSPS